MTKKTETKTTKGKRAPQQISYDDFETKDKFKDLLPRLSAGDYTKLKRSILKYGCRDPLIIWKRENARDVLVDGHHRYEICKENGIPYEVKFISFDGGEDEAVKWMLDNQRGRRNLTKFQLALIALEHKKHYKELAEARPRQKGENNYQNSDKKTNANKELGKLVGISHDTIGRIVAILKTAESNPDHNGLQKKVDALRNGKPGVSVNSVYAMVLEIRGTAQDNTPKKLTQEPTKQIDRAISRLDSVEEKLSQKDDRINLYDRVIKWAKDKREKASS